MQAQGKISEKSQQSNQFLEERSLEKYNIAEMAFLSIPVNNCCRTLNRSARLSDAIDEMFGLAFQPIIRYQCPRYLCLTPAQNKPAKQLCYKNNDRDNVKVAELDVSKYKPGEVECKVENGKVLVVGKQRIEAEHGYETSEFQHTYNLPDNVDPETVKSRIENGVLHIEGVKQQPEEVGDGNEDDKKLSLKINLGSYKPEEVNVKLQGNGLIVNAEHKTEQDGVYTCRHFKQYFTLPSEVDPSTLVTRLSQDGFLKIEAEKKPVAAFEDKDVEVQRDEEIPESTEE